MIKEELRKLIHKNSWITRINQIGPNETKMNSCQIQNSTISWNNTIFVISSWFSKNNRVNYDESKFSMNRLFRRYNLSKSGCIAAPTNKTVNSIVFDLILISKIFFLRIIRLEFPKNNLSMVRVSYYCVRLKDLTPLRCHMINSTWPWDPRTMTRYHVTWSCDVQF